MIKLLLPVDGSESANRAVRHLIALSRGGQPAELHLLNVRPPMDAWEVRRFLTEEEIAQTQRDEGEADLQSACALLDAAGLPYDIRIEVGPVAQTIAHAAVDLGCDAIVMGTHGRGGLASLFLGSVATKVVHLTSMPVTLVR